MTRKPAVSLCLTFLCKFNIQHKRIVWRLFFFRAFALGPALSAFAVIAPLAKPAVRAWILFFTFFFHTISENYLPNSVNYLLEQYLPFSD